MEFMEINDNGDISDSILWETLKVAMRGQKISLLHPSRKKEKGCLTEIERAFSALEWAYQISKTSDDYK